ncbi:MAG: hypothetical protein CM15mP59_5380 [Flavobacteriaceae bacterium]|nr:MAG: hypothetical protein CM15mP59_5380 [Flavobacteriaceae bacterium]
MRFNKNFHYFKKKNSFYYLLCRRETFDEESSQLHAETLLVLEVPGFKSLEGAILAFFRDGGSPLKIWLKAIDMGMDLKGNDMDMLCNNLVSPYKKLR